MYLKTRFILAVRSGELGHRNLQGEAIVPLRDFKKYFQDIPGSYACSFLPCATIEAGRHAMTATKFVFRVRPGVYRVHPDALKD